MLEELSDEELVALIETMEQWFREDTEIEEERYDDSTYTEPEPFLKDMAQHTLEREAMRKLLKAMEAERDRRNSTSAG